jgi:hypothetical protein
VRTFVTFHHDPGHTDDELDRFVAAAVRDHPDLDIHPGTEGAVFEPGSRTT